MSESILERTDNGKVISDATTAGYNSGYSAGYTAGKDAVSGNVKCTTTTFYGGYSLRINGVENFTSVLFCIGGSNSDEAWYTRKGFYLQIGGVRCACCIFSSTGELQTEVVGIYSNTYGNVSAYISVTSVTSSSITISNSSSGPMGNVFAYFFI